MYHLINSFSSKMVEKCNQEIDQIIQLKLKQLEVKALQEKEYDLFDILKNIDLKRLDKTQLELQMRGYSLELIQPQPEFNLEEGSMKATINTKQIKLIVRKVIFEI